MAHSGSEWEIRRWALEAIRKEWLFLNGRLAYQVGSGQRVRFWTGQTVWRCATLAFNDWEIELVEHFLHKIQVFRVQREEEDKVVWTTPKYGTFSIKSLYSILEPGGSSLFPSDSIWRVSVPPKVAFFAWEASWGKVLTLEQLQRREYSLANKCFLCLSKVGTMDHLLLHCVKTWVLWNLLFSLFGVD
ncbi:hypothetical protein CK203_038228 [Vitis vinifera]|uniref:Reverse transcriptase zinc-binding domain-containing protein n=1 Tax=Vitis vinifera TaxID=29760 RepID=A0A438IBS0_VITVI|nr:hypothetical protein CK203_038228 [Vitis vinifera]